MGFRDNSSFSVQGRNGSSSSLNSPAIASTIFITAQRLRVKRKSRHNSQLPFDGLAMFSIAASLMSSVSTLKLVRFHVMFIQEHVDLALASPVIAVCCFRSRMSLIVESTSTSTLARAGSSVAVHQDRTFCVASSVITRSPSEQLRQHG